MKVLIPVDTSDQALWTLKAAARFLDKATSEVYLFTVRVPVAAEVPWALMEADEEAVLRTLDRAKEESVRLGLNVLKTAHTTYHEPASAICDYANEIGADLILMGSHGYQGLEKFLMGSVSERVFKQASQPVVVVRNDKAHTLEISHADQAGLRPLKP